MNDALVHVPVFEFDYRSTIKNNVCENQTLTSGKIFTYKRHSFLSTDYVRKRKKTIILSVIR